VSFCIKIRSEIHMSCVFFLSFGIFDCTENYRVMAEIEAPHCSITVPNEFLDNGTLDIMALQRSSKFTFINRKKENINQKEVYTNLYYVHSETSALNNDTLLGQHRLKPIPPQPSSPKWSHIITKTLNFEHKNEKVSLSFGVDFRYAQFLVMKGHLQHIYDMPIRIRLTNIDLKTNGVNIYCYSCIRELNMSDNRVLEVVFEVNVKIESQHFDQMITKSYLYSCNGDGKFAEQ
jgi:hypothetical protein